MYVCVCVKHCKKYYQLWACVPFTLPALIMAHWNSGKLFISSAASPQDMSLLLLSSL